MHCTHTLCTLYILALIIPDNIKTAQRNLVAFHALFLGAAFVGTVLQATGCRHGYITGLLVTVVSVIFCLTFPVSDRKISARSISVVALYAVAMIMFLTAEFGQLEALPQIDQAALAERMRKMAAKPAFVVLPYTRYALTMHSLCTHYTALTIHSLHTHYTLTVGVQRPLRLVHDSLRGYYDPRV
jgi:hypothetical protein